MAEVTVVIPTFNCINYLKMCVNSIRVNSLTDPKVLLIIDGSTDGTREWAEQEGIEYVYRWEASRPQSQINGGTRQELVGRCYDNLDLGAVLANTNVVYFGNDDTVFSSGWDDRMLSYIEDRNLVANQIVEPGIDVPPWPGIIRHSCGASIAEFNLDAWNNFASRQAHDVCTEGWGLNIGIMCKRKFYIDEILPRGGYRWMDGPPENMWNTFKFTRVCGVALYHFSGRSSRCGGE